MGLLTGVRGTIHGTLLLLLVCALFSCTSEQAGPTGEEAEPPREVTKEVTKTVTVAETPKAPEAERDARAAPVSAESPPPTESGPDYVTVAGGTLSVEVPSSWGEIITGEDSEAGSSWSEFAGESVDYSLTAAPSLYSWGSAPGAPGVYAVASAGLAQRYANEELVAAGPNDMSGACEAGPQRVFERGPYSGLVQEWINCGEVGGNYLTLAATPPGEECVVLLTVGTGGQEGEAAGQHALDTFGADCGATASYPPESADEQYAPEQPEPEPIEDGSISEEGCPILEDGTHLISNSAGTTCVHPQTGEIFVNENPESATSLCPESSHGVTFQYVNGVCERTVLGLEEEETDETEVPEQPLARSPQPETPQYGGEPAPPPSAGRIDPNGDWTCDEIGATDFPVPPGSKHDGDNDGVACES